MLLEVKETLRLRETLVPVIFRSDGTHILIFAGDQKQWPVYMTIGNQSSKICKMPAAHNIVMVALLPIPIKTRNSPQKGLDELGKKHREVLNGVFRQVLQHLTFEHSPNAQTGCYNVLCADGNFRCCKPVLAAWLAEFSGYSDRHHLERHV